MAHEESQRICAYCEHPKRGHELPRVEGGHGGGHSGQCVVYGCNCQNFKPTEEFKDQEYTGHPMPSWVADGVKVKVKRVYSGFRMRTTKGSHSSDDGADPGEVGVIQRVDGIGWWDWQIQFSRGRHARLDEETLGELVRVRR